MATQPSQRRPLRLVGVWQRWVTLGRLAILLVLLGTAVSACVGGGDSAGSEAAAGSDGCPHWSPDSRWIAFDRLHGPGLESGDGQFEVWVVDRSGRALRRLTENPVDDSVLGWRSPLQVLVVRSSAESYDDPLEVYGVEPTRPATERRIRRIPGTPNYWELAPDGTRRPARFEGDDRVYTKVFVVTTRGGRVELPQAYVAEPTWSPDGQRLAYYESESSVITAERDGRVLGRLPARFPGGHLAWSPDSALISFLSRSGNVLVSLADGRGMQRVASSDGDWLAWSADGRTIFYESAAQIRAVRADGTDDRQVAPSGGDGVDCLSVSPDGRRIAFLRVNVVGGGIIQQTDTFLVVMNANGSGMRRVPMK